MGLEDVFKEGPLATQTLTIPAAKTGCFSCCDDDGSPMEPSVLPPKPLLVILPSQDGDYPVLLFLHGYLLLNSYYTQLLRHIASHGYITIAPQDKIIYSPYIYSRDILNSAFNVFLFNYVLVSQMYTVACADAAPEIKHAVAITEWLPTGFPGQLPANVRPDLQKVTVAGHSRGGKVAFGAALGRVTPPPSLPYAALVGVDPVDGTQPLLVSNDDPDFQLSIPVLVIGSGLGPVSRCPPFPSCAPEKVNHVNFFEKCRAPAYHFVATEYGHMDFLDEETSGVRGCVSYCLCKNGIARQPMRRFSAGVIVAFLNAWLGKDSTDLKDILANPWLAPVKMEPPQVLENVPTLQGIDLQIH